MDHALDVLTEFPIRKTKDQKQCFRNAVQSYLEQLSYPVTVENGSMGVRNLVIGDPEHAKFLITAHYDTCASLPFPNLITPCSFLLFASWQVLLVLLLAVPAGVIGGLVGSVLNQPVLSVPIAYVLLVGELLWMMIGPANRSNANDNTSGVVAVLALAAHLPEALRSHVCFVLFDLEEAGLLGSSAYRKKHRKASDKQIVFNLDCVGEGDEILLFPTKKAKKLLDMLDTCKKHCKTRGNKSVVIRDHGFSVYPSDQMNFPLGFGIAALCRSPWAGLYLAKIHTKKDTILDENNIALLQEYLISVIQEQV